MNTVIDTNEAKVQFSVRLKEKGLRNTRQRDIILDAFLGAANHITVEELHAIVTKSHPEIGYATVHRNLNLFCEFGIAEELKIGKQKTRYEQKVGHAHHDHLICERCGSFIEVHEPLIEQLQDRLAAANDFTPLRHKLEIYGICRGCRP